VGKISLVWSFQKGFQRSARLMNCNSTLSKRNIAFTKQRKLTEGSPMLSPFSRCRCIGKHAFDEGLNIAFANAIIFRFCNFDYPSVKQTSV